MKRAYFLLIVGTIFLLRTAAFALDPLDLTDDKFKMPVLLTGTSGSTGTPAMPVLPGVGSTDTNGKITITFTSGTLYATQLKELWARANYDGKTEYWKLDPRMLAPDGTALFMQFESKFNTKLVQLDLFGFDTTGKKTGYSNPIKISVNSLPSSVTMPVLPGTGTTDVNGRITVNFSSGTLFAAQLNELWAKVVYDTKTEYWKLDPGMLATNGESFSMQLSSAFNAKIIDLQLFGFDTSNRQTTYTNAIKITVQSATSAVAMPTLPSTGTTDAVGKITVTFASGTLLPAQLNELWARLDYDNKTEYWKLDPGMLSPGGTSFTMQFDSKFNGKHMNLELFGFDTLGRQTGYSNPIDITVSAQASSITMPTLVAPLTTDPNGKIKVNFSSGTLFASQFNELWARVNYDGKTEYWKLDPVILATDGASFSMQLGSAFHGKIMKLELFGIDTTGKKTGYSNQVQFTVDSSPSLVTMPVLPATGATDVNGKITVSFTGGTTLLASQLNELWARVNYDGKTEYWNIGKVILASDGKSFSMQFDPKFDGKVIKLELFGFDTGGKQTGYSTAIDITVDSNLSPVDMPNLPATGITNAVGKITVTFSVGTLFSTQLNELWARMTYDSKTEFWKLAPGMLAFDGKSFTMQFDSTFNGKTMKMELFGFDTTGKQTGFSSPIDITVNSSPSTIAMPTLPGTGNTDANGKITVTFSSGTLLPANLNELWARMTYEGKTEYWKLDPGMLATGGTSFTMQFDSTFDNKVMKLELFGFDTLGKQTGYSNPIDITVDSNPSAVAMPVLPAGPFTTDPNGNITVTFASGTLLPAQLNELWARVNYEGKTEYWNLGKTILASDGKSFAMQFESKFHAKTINLELFGFDTGGKQTGYSNQVQIIVDSTPSSVTMPTLPATATTDVNGKLTVTFGGGTTLFSTQLNELWARMNYDGKTEFWKLAPGMLAFDGKSFSMQFDSTFNGKTMKIELFGFDTSGRKTGFSNQVEVTVNSSPSAVAMPVLPSVPLTTDVNGKINITFSSGTLLPASLKELWARMNYDGKTEYWKLDPGMLATNGLSLNMQFDSTFNAKVMKMELFGFDTGGKQTGYSNQAQITVNSSPSAVTMPALPTVPSPLTTDPNGQITMTFTGGTTLLPGQLNELWARVNYEGKTEYWKLDPLMLATDGKSFSMQLSSAFHAKTISLELFGFDTGGKQTGYSNQVQILVNSSPSAITMPTLPSPLSTDPVGKITVNFSGGTTLLASNLNELWARVTYDGKTEYWKLDPGMLSTAGTSFSMQFSSAYNAKIMKLELFGFDTLGKQTGFSNPTNITVFSGFSSVVMPTFLGTGNTNAIGKITIGFTGGTTLFAGQLNEFWARATYDGKTEYWKLDPAMLATDGASLSMQFESKFNGKVVKMEFFGIDTLGKQTGFSLPINITVTSGPSAITMPTLPSPLSTDPVGKITVNFSGGTTLLASNLNELWARVTYDGKIEYWKLDPGMLSTAGTSFSMQFSSTYNGKIMKLELFGFDTSGKQTGFSNPTNITVASGPSAITMPTLPSPLTTDSVGKITLNFSGGTTLLASNLNELWARVTYDGKIEYWKLDPGMLAIDGSSLSMQFESKFNAKIIKLELFGFDTLGKQTVFSNTTNITVFSGPSAVAMPTLPGTGATDIIGKITVNFSSGTTLLASQLNEL